LDPPQVKGVSRRSLVSGEVLRSVEVGRSNFNADSYRVPSGFVTTVADFFHREWSVFNSQRAARREATEPVASSDETHSGE